MKVIRTRSVCLTPTSCPSRGLRSPANLAGLPESFQTDQMECARTALPLTSLLPPCPPGSMACRPGPPSQDTTHCQASKHTSVPDSPGGFKSTIGGTGRFGNAPPGFRRAAFSLCPHLAFPGCAHREGGSSPVSSYEGADPFVRGISSPS